MNRQDRIFGIVGLALAGPLAVIGYIVFQQPGSAAFNAFLGGIATLALYSILYRENPIYRLFEHVYVGLAAGYISMMAITSIIRPRWYEPVFEKGLWLWLWALPLALLAYFVFSRKHGWLSRIPLVILAGFAAGQAFQSFANLYFPQIRDSFRPLWPTLWQLSNPSPSPDSLSISGAINNGIFLVTLVSVLTYFLFSFEHKRPLIRNTAQLGRWLIMIGFGAIFGSTIMTRFALLVDRMSFLLVEWLRLRGPI
ncbi:MAG TPA: hypothetical protein VLH79_14880 [Chthonomonadales bacterium]|nr:hypothetical protein [Chthonomonadales bacterium]